ncbi:arginine repressor [Ligilactobacillus salivarius]|uniref:Arginine repressor n=1 Tax=Ligilactobacillus salivarius (strain UCC118) TaxID=362948 RepID=Q1WV69_LIGS1|nr:arginine repressor [Ligilactobacillus salivarius]ABD99048.1 Arginine repressor, argR [Ligilactobacillus salivarius UCC118]OQQ77865.1 arginine repressor [Ligilactobacillus salivarius]OQR21897.1 arginine repressor [Ligilactobacillus salivarius]
MNRIARRELMEQLFADNKITTQEQLQQLLRSEGVEVTQATISRDMRILNIVKVSDQNGNTYYKQMKVEGEKNYERLFQEINDNVLGIQRINFINLIRTTVNSSYANILAAKLDDLELAEIAGTLAGNDTVVVFSKNEEDAEIVYKMIYEHMDGDLK